MTINKQKEFQILMEKKVSDGLTTYIDAMSAYMIDNELEAKEMLKLISDNLQEKIKIEAVANNLIINEGLESSLPL